MPIGDILPPSLTSLTLFQCSKYQSDMFVGLAESLQHKLPLLADLTIAGLTARDGPNRLRDWSDVQIHKNFRVRFRGEKWKRPHSTS